MIVEKAKEKYFFQQDPKAFVSKMRFSDILQERKLQMKQSQLIKNRWKLYDEYWDDIEKKRWKIMIKKNMKN